MKRMLIVLCMLAWGGSYAQGVQWPDALVIGELPLAEETPHPAAFKTVQTLYSKTYSSHNQMAVHFQKDDWTLSQQLIYSVERDDWLGSINHFSDMRGRALVKGNDFIDQLGLEWAPLTSYHSQSDGNVFQTLIDVGPVVRFSPFDMPLTVHGGLSAIAWNKELPTLRQLVTSELNDTLGIYGGVEIGKMKNSLGALPLYFNGSMQGRAVEGAREIRGHAGLLLAVQMQSGDSLFAFVGDTISDGNDAFLSQGFDQWGGYVNNPHTIENSFNFTAGVKRVERNGFSPAIHYLFREYSLWYPSDKNLLNDNRQRTHGLNLSLLSTEMFSVDYAGNVYFSWEEDDKLFNRKTLDDAARVVDIRDYEVFAAEMNHAVSKNWENGLGFDYTLYLSRYLREYPRIYTTGFDTLESNDDYDEVVRKHGLTLSVLPLEKVNVDLIGGYAVNYLYLLKAEQSDRSYIDRRYEVGIRTAFKPSESFVIEEKLTASADQREFKYKLNRGRFPEQSRSLFSDLTARWKISDSWSFSGQWTRSDWDNGYWDAAAYRDTIIDTLSRKNYYAIHYKSTDQTLLLSSDLQVNEHLALTGGCEFRDVYFREFKDGRYVNNDLGAGYFAGPFVRIHVMIPKPAYLGKTLSLKGHIRRSIDDIANDFWDVNFTLQSVF